MRLLNGTSCSLCHFPFHTCRPRGAAVTCAPNVTITASQSKGYASVGDLGVGRSQQTMAISEARPLPHLLWVLVSWRNSNCVATSFLRALMRLSPGAGALPHLSPALLRRALPKGFAKDATTRDARPSSPAHLANGRRVAAWERGQMLPKSEMGEKNGTVYCHAPGQGFEDLRMPERFNPMGRNVINNCQL